MSASVLAGQPPDSGAVRMQWGVRIPMRDGVRLSATLYLPSEEHAPAPVLFLLTPYVAQISHETGVYFAAHGSPFLTVDVRGRGNSDGSFKADGNEAHDGYDIVEWLAGQPYCNGKVAMCGGSYSGYVQWCAAKMRPPHLATIVPVASPYRGVDSPAPRNIFPAYRVQWLNLLAGHTSQEKIFADQAFWNQQFRRWFESGGAFAGIDSFLGNPSPIFQEWLAHPERDAYWDSYNPTPGQYAEIDLPVLTITGAYDGNQLGALTHYREHLQYGSPIARSNHYLIIGPWDHAGTRFPKAEFGGLKVGPASLLDLQALQCQWYEYTLRGGSKPAFLQKRVAYYVLGAERWRYADTLEEVTARTVALYLDSSGEANDVFRSGSLRAGRPGEGEPECYVHDPRDITLAELESSIDPASCVDQRLVHASAGRHLVYHSEPFRQDTEVSGFFRLAVWLSIDQPDTDFQVALFDVDADGSAIRLATDCMRARYRESPREPKLINTSSPLLYELDQFNFVSREIRTGHRLRMVLGPLHSIHWQKNYNSGGVVAAETALDARTVTVRLFHDAKRPSALYVPLGRPED
jgi:putative CocE/NonD family hydrolase